MQSDTEYRQSPASKGRSVHCWEVVDRQIAITARAGVAGAIWRDIDERGETACGFLLGRMLETGESQSLYIESIMPLVLASQAGGSGIPDLGRLAEAMSKVQQEGKDPAQCAGCYVARSEFDELESTLLPALYAPLFSTAISAVVVLVPRTADCDCRLEVVSPSIAAGVVPEFQFKLREYVLAERGLAGDTDDRPLVLEMQHELTSEEAVRPEPVQPPTISVVPEPLPPAIMNGAPKPVAKQEPAPPPPPRLSVVTTEIAEPMKSESISDQPTQPSAAQTRRTGYRKWVWIALALLAGGASGVLASRLWRLTQRFETGDLAGSFTVPEQPGSKLALQVARRGNDLELSWNRNVEVLGTGARGILRINDSGTRSEILLDSGQLRNGRVLYVPRSGDVEVTLAVQSAGGTTLTDTLRVLQPGFAAARGASPVQEPLRSNPPPTGTAQRAAPASVKSPAREFVLPSAAGSRSAVAKPGTIRVEPAVLGSSLNALQNPPIPFSSPALVPPVSAPPPAKPYPPVSRPPERSAERPSTVPAVPLRQAPLSIPGNLRQRLPEELAIKVEVTVDAEGRVTDAVADRQSTPSATELAAIAAANVRRWQFVPASVGGKPVVSKYVVTFHVKR